MDRRPRWTGEYVDTGQKKDHQRECDKTPVDFTGPGVHRQVKGSESIFRHGRCFGKTKGG